MRPCFRGCTLIDNFQDVTWIPCDDAALALVQMRSSNEPILHLAHPQPISWARFLQPIAQDLQASLVPYADWISALEKHAGVENMRDIPALRLLGFFQSVDIDAGREPLGNVPLDTRKAVQAAPALKLPELNAEHAERWLKAWKETGFIE